MSEWLKDGFASAISFFFVLTVILCIIGGGVVGYGIGELGGCILGLIIGFFLGDIVGILTFGFMATIIHISDRLDGLYHSQDNLAQPVSAAISNENTSSENIWVCTNCGESNPAGTRFCRKCGK